MAKKVIAYTVGWDHSGLTNIQNNPRTFSNVSPWAYTLDTSGNIIPDPTAGAATLVSDANLQYYKNNGIKVTPALHNIVNGQWNGGNIVSNMLATTASMDNHIANIVALVTSKLPNGQDKFDGIDIDYENLNAADRTPYTQFLTKLANEMHSRGKIIGTDVYGKDTEPGGWGGQQAQDYAAIGAVVDEVRFMMYDFNPGVNQSQTPWWWLNTTFNFAAGLMPLEKIIVGVPMYGYDWTSTTSTGVTYAEVQALITQYNPTIQYDATDKYYWFTYTAPGAIAHTVRYETAATTQEKLNFVNDRNLAGIHIWRMGGEDPATWQNVRTTFGLQPSVSRTINIGTLNSNSSRAQAQADAGVDVATVELNWSLMEPENNIWDKNHIAQVKNAVTAHKAAGKKITLGLGLHSYPTWISTIPNYNFKNIAGGFFNAPNLVFNQLIRNKVERYFRRLDYEFDLDSIWAVRLTSGATSSMLYPAGGSFWAHDTNALGGPNLPATLSANPLPAWTPGSATVTATQARNWLDWYIQGLVDVTNWQQKSLISKGFNGYFELIMPGAGVTFDVDTTVTNRFNDSHASNLARGAVWHRYLAMLSDKRNVVAFCSTLAEGTNGPGSLDVITTGDFHVPINDATAQTWSTARWMKRLADENGVLVGGSNPGYNNPSISTYNDTTANGMMAQAFKYASDGKFHSFYWDSDDNLYNGTGPAFSTFATHIANF